MQVPLQITVRHMSRSDALEARVREQAAKLEGFHPNLVSCRVTVEELARHQSQGRQFQVRIEVGVPGRNLVAANHDEDVYVALRDAFEAVARQVEDDARVTRGDVKSHKPT